MILALEIIKTSDGSDSLLNTTLNETYHSVHGAIQESEHVFIKAGLEFVVQYSNTSSIHILEIGFGTGLNALLSLQHGALKSKHFQYTTLEAFPLEEKIWSGLNYGEKLGAEKQFDMLHRVPWEAWSALTHNFSLLKKKDTLQNIALASDQFHLIYFDAFAPSKQPEMWEFDALEKLANSLLPGGVFVTYCAKGQLKRDLKKIGLVVETLPGPPGKNEMVRAIKPEI